MVTNLPLPRRVIIGGGGGQVARSPAELLEGNPETMYFFSGYYVGSGNDISVDDYQSMSDQTIRDRIDSRIYQTDDWGVKRSTYLNEDTLGYVLLDIEGPFSLGGIRNMTNDEITWFVEGLIRRINIFREFCPNAKIGVWRYGDGLKPDVGVEELESQIQNFVTASNVRYEGNSFYDSVDFLSPANYMYLDNTPCWDDGERTRILAGHRTDSLQKVCNAIIASGSVVKPVIPIFAFSSQAYNQCSGTQSEHYANSVEIHNLRDYAEHFVAWYASRTQMQDRFDFDKTRLLNEIAERSRGPVVI
jgi:hypothetical protein